MDTTIMFTPRLLIGGFLSVCAGISCIAAAVGWVIKIIRFAGKPAKKTNDRLNAIKNTLAEHEDFLANDKQRLQSIEDGNKITQKAILALLAHGIDGNDIDAMKKAKNELQEYLIGRT